MGHMRSIIWRDDQCKTTQDFGGKDAHSNKGAKMSKQTKNSYEFLQLLKYSGQAQNFLQCSQHFHKNVPKLLGAGYEVKDSKKQWEC